MRKADTLQFEGTVCVLGGRIKRHLKQVKMHINQIMTAMKEKYGNRLGSDEAVRVE